MRMAVPPHSEEVDTTQPRTAHTVMPAQWEAPAPRYPHSPHLQHKAVVLQQLQVGVAAIAQHHLLGGAVAAAHHNVVLLGLLRPVAITRQLVAALGGRVIVVAGIITIVIAAAVSAATTTARAVRRALMRATRRDRRAMVAVAGRVPQPCHAMMIMGCGGTLLGAG